MKLSKNVLVGSLAVSGMVLGAIAPALTAQAATTSGTVDADGNVQAVKDADGNITTADAGQLGKGNLAIAYDEKGDGAAATTGTATAGSNAAVQVINGVLVLDKVPDFNFGAAAQETTKVMQDNTKTASNSEAVDGNADGILQVTESRSQVPGFTVSATLGNFVNSDNSAITTGGKGADFSLNLKATDLTLNDAAWMNGNIAKQTSAATLPSDGTTSKNVLQESTGNYTTGTYAAKYDENATDPTSLYVGNMGKTGTDAPSVQAVHSTITWTLAAAAVTA
ncbi:WxL domain-containing protein [Companilactobacillus huachuanensis]|uniref:WxL domain-containing protein n=1 Tax=Companilactobacillus huachuanensis TaxID=2559914 RepID=A0ABW1RPK9_9LACO|nr:WxL domain-containing protein [Companilactobacillus huachuanensis]